MTKKTKASTKPMQAAKKTPKRAVKKKALPADWKDEVVSATQLKFGRKRECLGGPKGPTIVSEGVDNDTYYVVVDGEKLEASRTQNIHRALAIGRAEYLRCNGRHKIEVRRESDEKVLAASCLAMDYAFVEKGHY